MFQGALDDASGTTGVERVNETVFSLDSETAIKQPHEQIVATCRLKGIRAFGSFE